MNILIAAATAAEISPVLHYLRSYRVAGRENGYKKDHLNVQLCITGIGSTATAYQLSKSFSQYPSDLAIQAGIAGAFSPKTPIGSVWRVHSETFADLGAENGNRYLDLFELGFLDADMYPFQQKRMPGGAHSTPVLSELPEANAITVNTVSGNEDTIKKRAAKYHPDLESMEGAAFHYVCLMEKINFVQIRSVSNYVEVRDKSKWNIPLAVKQLNNILIRLIETL